MSPPISSPPTVEYLCELGIQLYRQGNYNDALSEFGAVLNLEPDNKTALKYIDAIFGPEGQPVKIAEEPHISKYDAMEDALNSYGKKPSREEAVQNALEIAGIKVSGEAQLRLGLDSDNLIWKRANWDMNERNWRMLSNNGLNNRQDTYDARIYDRLRVNLDANKDDENDGFAFHSDITVDPWSFTGKSPQTTVTGTWGDTANVRVLYIGNTQYSLNQIFMTNRFGDSFILPELKLYNGKTSATTISGAFVDQFTHLSDIFSIPQMDINFQFQPVRELWVDYNKDDRMHLRLYPIGYENQALSFDDPLKLSNNHIWWRTAHGLMSGPPVSEIQALIRFLLQRDIGIIAYLLASGIAKGNA